MYSVLEDVYRKDAVDKEKKSLSFAATVIFYVVTTPADSVRACVGSALEHSAIKDRVRENSRSLQSNTSTVRAPVSGEGCTAYLSAWPTLWFRAAPPGALNTSPRTLFRTRWSII
jgi:hypothetical protein